MTQNEFIGMIFNHIRSLDNVKLENGQEVAFIIKFDNQWVSTILKGQKDEPLHCLYYIGGKLILSDMIVSYNISGDTLEDIQKYNERIRDDKLPNGSFIRQAYDCKEKIFFTFDDNSYHKNFEFKPLMTF